HVEVTPHRLAGAGIDDHVDLRIGGRTAAGDPLQRVPGGRGNRRAQAAASEHAEPHVTGPSIRAAWSRAITSRACSCSTTSLRLISFAPMEIISTLRSAMAVNARPA